jgi:hypothetical protein
VLRECPHRLLERTALGTPRQVRRDEPPVELGDLGIEEQRDLSADALADQR